MQGVYLNAPMVTSTNLHDITTTTMSAEYMHLAKMPMALSCDHNQVHVGSITCIPKYVSRSARFSELHDWHQEPIRMGWLE